MSSGFFRRFLYLYKQTTPQHPIFTDRKHRAKRTYSFLFRQKSTRSTIKKHKIFTQKSHFFLFFSKKYTQFAKRAPQTHSFPIYIPRVFSPKTEQFFLCNIYNFQLDFSTPRQIAQIFKNGGFLTNFRQKQNAPTEPQWLRRRILIY